MLQGPEGRRLDPADRIRLSGDRSKLVDQEKSYLEQLKYIQQDKEQLIVRSPIDGQVTTWQVDDLLIHRPVEKGQILMEVVEPRSDWQLELFMPEDRMGYLNEARREIGEDLPVSYITATDPGATHEGTVKEVGRTAEIRGEEGNTVLIRVAINKQDLGTEPRPGATVTGKVYVGRASLGYVWFHDLISFVQRKIIFRFF